MNEKITEFVRKKAAALYILCTANDAERERRCLEFKQYLEANPDAFKDPSKVIVLDSVSPREGGQV